MLTLSKTFVFLTFCDNLANMDISHRFCCLIIRQNIYSNATKG